MKYIEYKTYQYFHRTYLDDMDCFYDSQLVYLFLNRFNYSGGKSLNYRLLYDWLYFVKRVGFTPLDYLYKAVYRNRLNIKTAHILISGRSHNIPIPIMNSEGLALVMRYVLKGTRLQEGKYFKYRFGDELEAIIYKLAKSHGKEAMTKMLQQAKEDHIYMHYRWR